MSEKSEARMDMKVGFFVGMGMTAAIAALMMAFVLSRFKSVDSEAKKLRAEVEELKKFEADTKVMLPAVVVKMQELCKSQETIQNDVRSSIGRQEAELVLTGRVLSNREGGKRWAKMVEEARSELQAEVDAAKKAQEQSKK